MPIDRLRFVRYKGFEEFTAYFRDTTLLVGPNNAGKTTIINAVRLCATLLAQAKRRRPDMAAHDETRGRRPQAYPVGAPAHFVAENIQHEFRNEEARLELRFKNKAMLYVVWPAGGGDPFYYLEYAEGLQPTSVRVAKEKFSSIGVVPVLTPIEHSEASLSAQHVKDNLITRLVSRHFRNQLLVTRTEDPGRYNELEQFILQNTPEIDALDLVQAADGDLDLYFRESNSGRDKELCWAGDGLQIWLQVLFHISRQVDIGTLILDEPDVFLHPDLQRRLVRVLEELSCQVVLATHAPEMLSEASRDAVVIVDRTRRRSRRVSNESVLGDLNDVLGSGFNLRLARALRSKVALFVEGKDMRILKNIAKATDAELFSSERGLTVAEMEGASNRHLASSFGWLNEHLLDNSVHVAVFLDRDYMTSEMAHDIVLECQRVSVHAHVWERKELESYLLVPSLIARVSGADEQDVESYLYEAVESLRGSVLSRYLPVRVQIGRASGKSEVTLTEHYIDLFDKSWQNKEWALYAAPAKDVLSALNRKLQECGEKAVSARALSSRIRYDEIAPEMRDALLDVERLLAAPAVVSPARR